MKDTNYTVAATATLPCGVSAVLLRRKRMVLPPHVAAVFNKSWLQVLSPRTAKLPLFSALSRTSQILLD